MNLRFLRGVGVGLGVLICSLAPSTAHAGVPSNSERHDALRFAENFWHERGESAYCPGRVRLRVGPDDPNVLGWVNSPFSCTIWLNYKTEWSDGGETDSWWRVCATAIHEYGHLVGRRHSRNPESIMAGYSRLNEESSWWPYFSGCRYENDDKDGDGSPDW